jgi:AcrR family transcriptional regulator
MNATSPKAPSVPPAALVLPTAEMMSKGRGGEQRLADRAAPASRTPRNAEATRKRILDCAEHEFANKGFDGARLSGIAKAALVQSALIHHYYEDKEGLHHAVLSRALEAMGAGVAPLIEALTTSLESAETENRRLGFEQTSRVVTAFVLTLTDFFSSHNAVLAILHHEALAKSSLLETIMAQSVRPLFDAVVDRIEQMRVRGDLRADLNSRHFALSVISMVAFPFQQAAFVRALWPARLASPELDPERHAEVCKMVLAQVCA